MTYESIDQIKRANERLGHYWFSANNIAFFKSRVESGVIGGRYFVSSEQGPNNRRRYSIRVAKSDGAIDTVGEFQAYGTRAAALAEAKHLAGMEVQGK